MSQLIESSLIYSVGDLKLEVIYSYTVGENSTWFYQGSPHDVEIESITHFGVEVYDILCSSLITEIMDAIDSDIEP
jgi:hypothetical protein|tara:strand:- start:8169 stop:8396 length:228 start_codon:yes stop_codon:yes gene_type:complete